MRLMWTRRACWLVMHKLMGPKQLGLSVPNHLLSSRQAFGPEKVKNVDPKYAAKVQHIVLVPVALCCRLSPRLFTTPSRVCAAIGCTGKPTRA